MNKYINIKILTLLLTAVLLYPKAADCQQKTLQKVNFLPLWVPQPQFAGYYMAREKGIYAKYGIDVNIIPGGYLHEVPASLKSGAADLGIMFLYTGLMERAKGVKVVNIGQIFQRSSIMFIAKKKSGIKTLQDFNGKRIGVWRTVAKELTAGFLQSKNINAQIVEFDKGINIFLKDAVDVTVMMNYNEYKRLINSGVNPDEVIKFNFYDYEMNFSEDGIYCMEDFYINNQDLCRRFVQASLEGWEYALSNMQETINVLDRFRHEVNVAGNLAHSSWQLKSMEDMIRSSGKNVIQGQLLESDFDYLNDFLFRNRFITDKPAYTDFYKGSR